MLHTISCQKVGFISEFEANCNLMNKESKKIPLDIWKVHFFLFITFLTRQNCIMDMFTWNYD